MLKALLAGALIAPALSRDAFAADRSRTADEGTIGDRWMFGEGATPGAPGYPGDRAVISEWRFQLRPGQTPVAPL